MPSKKVIVTGGAGFIGSNLVEELSKQHSVTVIDDRSTGRMENIAHIKNVEEA
jgi:nucleoside-diphosphate-sugar epimerase